MHGSTRCALACMAALLAATWGPTTAAAAEIARCTDAVGKVSYTDKACPSSTLRSERLEGVETNGTAIASPAATYPPPARVGGAAAAAGQRAAPTDSGLVVIDPRADARRQQDSQARGDAERDIVYPSDDPYAGYSGYTGYPGYAGGYRRRQPPPQDLRPTLRSCDAGGCNDTMGNHYDRAGKVDRFTRPDGRTCRPVGTTVVC